MPTRECKVELAVLERSMFSWFRQQVLWPVAWPRTGAGAVPLTEEWWVCRGRRCLRRGRRPYV